MKQIAWERITLFVFAILSGIAAAYYGQSYIHQNDKAINIIVTVFSILAGFLVALMTIMGDPGGYTSRSWRFFEIKKSIVFSKLARQKWLFNAYLITLGAIFFSSLIEKKLPTIALYCEYFYLGLAVTAFILSLSLPTALMNIQIARHDELIEAKRKAAGIKKNDI